MRYTKIALFTFAILAVFVSCASDSKSLSVDPKNVDFEAVHIGNSVSKNVTLTNKYGKQISISEISLSGSGDFYITSVIPSPLILANKEEHVLTLEYSPSNPGPTTALMTIKHSGATKDKEVIIEGEGVAVPRITVPVDTYDFQTALINTTITHDFYIENSGTAAMSINNFNLLGSGFSISAGGNTPVNVAVGASHMITVEFAPLVATTYSVVITISCDAVNNSPEKTITIDGEGVTVTPKITLNRTDPWDFGQVTSNLPLTMDLKMENTGGDPLTISDVQLNTGTDFFITSIEDSNNLPISLPQVLQPGTFIYAMVKFEPTVTSLLNDKLIITHDAINAAKPLEMTVQGDGTFVKEKNYYYTGAVQTWTIPAGITKITIECWGAQGETTFGVGGKGGYATGDLVVSPGETISIYVGGQKGWNGGGPNSVGGGTSGGVSAPGGYGGGASDVRQGGNNLTDRKIVAGGGGGGGGDGAGSVYGKGGDGGAGGGSVGNAGVNGNGGTAGQGGTQTAGGTYGTGNSNCSITGESGKVGQLGLGGDGGDGIQGCGGYTGGGGGGGGGGYFGGGGAGGAAAGSGGAWSGGGGGGGSSYIGGVTNSSTQTGIRTGDGEVKITWQ